MTEERISKILVIGGTGMLGQPVARQMAEDGFAVRVLTRSPHKARSLFPEPFEVVAGEVEDPASLEAALQGCQGVHINLQDNFDYDLERRGAENAVRAAAKAGVQRVTYTSGASVCQENCWYPGTRAKFQAETAIQASGIPYTIFRDNFFMEVLHNLVRGKMALHIGKHPTPYSWIASADYARMVARAYATPEAAGKVLYVAGPEKLSMRQALQTFCRIVHPQARLVYMPIWVTWIVAILGRRKQLQGVLPFFRYCETVRFEEHPEQANTLLGAPSTTLEAWSQQQAARPRPL